MPVADAVTPSRNLRSRTTPAGETTPAAKKTPKATKDVEMTEAAPAPEAKSATPAKAKAATPAKPAKAAAPAKAATPAKPAAAAPPAAAKKADTKADTKMTDVADTKKADTKKADTKKAEPAKKADTKKADTKKAEPAKKAGTKRRAEETEERSSKRQKFTSAPSFKVGDVIQVKIFSITPKTLFVDHEGRRGYLNLSAIPTANIKNVIDLKDTTCPALVTDIFERDGESHYRVSCRPEDVSAKKDTSAEFKKDSNATFHGVVERALNPRKPKGAKPEKVEKKMVSVIIIGASPTHHVAVPREKGLEMLSIVKVKKVGTGYEATPVK